MSAYAKLIASLDSSVDPVAVECFMRNQYGTLGHLCEATFRSEIRLFKACEAERPGFGAMLKRSHGEAA